MRTSTRLPWFQFFPADWLTDIKITLMTPAEEGAYIRLLSHAWNDPACSLPDDDAALASLSRLGDGWSKESAAKLRACFIPYPKKPGRLTDGKLYKEFLKVKRSCKERSASGLKGAQSLWRNKQLHDGSANGSAIAQPMANDGYSDSDSDSDSETRNTDRLLKKNESVRVSSFMSQEPEAAHTQAQKNHAACRADAAQAAFELFWKAYPNKVAPQPVKTWFRAHPVTPNLICDMELAIKRQVTSNAWRRDEGRYIPYPAKWLTDECWQNEGLKVKRQLVD